MELETIAPNGHNTIEIEEVWNARDKWSELDLVK